MSSFSEHLRRLRTRAGLTQSALAHAIGLSGNSLISRLESGAVSPSDVVLHKLATFFDQDPEAMLALMQTARPSEDPLFSEVDLMAREAAQARQHLETSVTSLLGEFEEHRDALRDFVSASKLNLVWSLSRKLRRESRANEVWVLSPGLDSETDFPEIRAVVKGNLARGVPYRYLICESGPVLARARDLVAKWKGQIEIRVAPEPLFEFAVETVIYDPRTQNRVSLMVAPTRRPEFDVVVGAVAADRFEDAFRKWWPESIVVVGKG